MDTEYDCHNCGCALYFDTDTLHFRHKARLSPCDKPLARPVQVTVGVVCPPKQVP